MHPVHGEHHLPQQQERDEESDREAPEAYRQGPDGVKTETVEAP